MLWCQTQGWSAWTLETAAYAPSGEASVGTTKNIQSPYVVSSASGIYVVGGVETQTVTDQGLLGASGKLLGNNNVLSSHYLLKLNHGGGLDRTVSIADDNRCLPGQYEGSTHWAYITGFTAGANTVYNVSSVFNAQIGDQVYINTGNAGLDGLQNITAIGALTITTDKDSTAAPAAPSTGVLQGLTEHLPGNTNFLIARPPELVFSETVTNDPAAQQNVYRIDFEWVPSSSASGGGDLPSGFTARIAFDSTHWHPSIVTGKQEF